MIIIDAGNTSSFNLFTKSWLQTRSTLAFVPDCLNQTGMPGITSLEIDDHNHRFIAHIKILFGECLRSSHIG